MTREAYTRHVLVFGSLIVILLTSVYLVLHSLRVLRRRTSSHLLREFASFFPITIGTHGDPLRSDKSYSEKAKFAHKQAPGGVFVVGYMKVQGAPCADEDGGHTVEHERRRATRGRLASPTNIPGAV